MRGTAERIEVLRTIVGGIAQPPIGHVHGYRPAGEDGTRVTSYHDWSAVRPLGSLERVARRGYRRPGRR